MSGGTTAPRPTTKRRLPEPRGHAARAWANSPRGGTTGAPRRHSVAPCPPAALYHMNVFAIT